MKHYRALLIAAFGLAAANTHALTVSYGWEDGNTVLGGYANDHLDYSNTSSLTRTGNGALSVNDSDAGDNGTAQSYVAWINGLQTGDQVAVDFWSWDTSTGTDHPSVRLWAHYTDNAADVNDYDGSASGNYTYSIGESRWDNLSHTWTFDAAESFDGDADGLMIEMRYYDSADSPTGYALIDDLTVSVSNDLATITTPGGVTAVPVPTAAWLFASAMVALAGLARTRRAY